MVKLEAIRNKEPRLIVGIETGDVPYYLAAVATEVEGLGDETVCNMIYNIRHELPEDLQRMLASLAVGDEFNGEEIAGINFLVLHNLSAMYHHLLEEAELEEGDIDLIGLKCMEIGGKVFPADPAVFSEMVNCVVASQFSIDVDGSNNLELPVREAILKELVEEMIEKCEMEEEDREALGVALLANEALYFNTPQPSRKAAAGPGGASGQTGIQKPVEGRADTGKAVLLGNFYFPE